jgi:hypothetical protein
LERRVTTLAAVITEIAHEHHADNIVALPGVIATSCQGISLSTALRAFSASRAPVPRG